MIKGTFKWIWILALPLTTLFAGNWSHCITSNPDEEAITNLFVETFGTLFDYPPGFLEDTIADELAREDSDWVLTYDGDKLVGCVILDMSNYPNWIYMRQGFVYPSMIRTGVLKSMFVYGLDYYPDFQVAHYITRKTNEVSIQLAKRFGFEPSDYMEKGYDPEIYCGFSCTREKLKELKQALKNEI